MKSILKSVPLAALLIGSLCAYNFSSGSSAAITGIVTDEHREPVQGVTVVVKHLPTNTYRGTLTLGDGTYNLRNLRDGGPYLLTLSCTGYKVVRKDSIMLRDGQKVSFNFVLKQ